MDILHAALLGVVEGITEFLPVSSTGHLILANHLLGIPESDFVKSFDIIIQLGAILAVVVLYWKTLWNVELIKRLIVGFLPTGTIGFIVYKIVKHYLLGNDTVVLWTLLLGGIALIVFELLFGRKATHEESMSEVTYKQAFWIGCFQTIAVIPGVSRSAATIVGGMLLGLSRRTIVEFSFLLVVPTMLAATGYDLLKSYSGLSSGETSTLVVGFIVSFLVALLGIKFLLAYVKRYDFIPFGVYRILLALAFFFLIR